jgi:hypothetical protein
MPALTPLGREWVDRRETDKEERTMSLIFDSFESVEDARAFIAAVTRAYPEHGCQLFTDSESAHEHDFFPFVQEPIVVHVDRVRYDDEAEIEAIVNDFTGQFIGT